MMSPPANSKPKAAKSIPSTNTRKGIPRTTLLLLATAIFIILLWFLLPSNAMSIPIAIGGGISFALILYFIQGIFIK